MKRVLLHVGTPKTGTSFLQDVLLQNSARLAEHDVHYPAQRFDEHFLAALDLMQLTWGGLETQAIGAWGRLAAAVRRIEHGTVIVSHEILARATRAQAERAVADLGANAEVHVVISARDLARQIPAEWQENIKHRRTFSYARFLRLIQDPERSSSDGSWFWGVQELPAILDRWGATLPPERLHVITVPPAGSDRDLLWKRFVETFGLGGIELDLSNISRANPSLGVPETALLRRINWAVNDLVPSADYRPAVREQLAHGTLARRQQSPRLAVPPEVFDWVEGISRSWVADLRERGCQVVGDLDDLVGQPPRVYVSPDKPVERQVSAAAVDAISTLLVEQIKVVHERDRLAGDLEAARREIETLRLTFVERVKRRILNGLDRSRVGRGVHQVYRAARGRDRSSRRA